MARKKKASVALVDIKIPLKESDKHLIEGGELHILFNSATAKRIPIIRSALRPERGIPTPDEIDNISAISDVLCLQLSMARPELDSESVVFQVQQYYRRLGQQVDRAATFIALTDNVVIPDSIPESGAGIKRPEPYTLEELTPDVSGPTIDGDTDAPSWRTDEAKMIWPPVKYNLDNLYERRLKWLNDTIDQFDIVFQVELNNILDDHILKSMKGLAETDQDGFQPAGVGGAVSVLDDA
jgi:hypothetical protein